MLALESLDIHPSVIPLRVSLVATRCHWTWIAAKDLRNQIRYTMSQNRCVWCSLEQGIFSALF